MRDLGMRVEQAIRKAAILYVVALYYGIKWTLQAFGVR